MTKQAKFTYSPFEKTLEELTKTIEDQRTKESQALNTLNCANEEELSIKLS